MGMSGMETAAVRSFRGREVAVDERRNRRTKQMKATQAYRGHFLPKKCFGKRTLRECSTSGKTDNIVLIEVDSDDFGDVIILDIPESFQEKFKKNSDQHVIKIDDEDGSESEPAACDMDIDHTPSNNFAPTSAAPSSNCDNMNAFTNHEFPPASAPCSSTCADDEDCLAVNTPVKLSKSKRTYSGKSISRNHYGLSPDSESSSESDCSDCELMEGSSGKLREQWEKASNRRREPNHQSEEVNESSTSAANHPVHHSNEESSAGHSEPTSQQSNSSAVNHESNGQKLAEESKFFQKDPDISQMEENFPGRHDSYSYSDFKKKGDTSTPEQPVDDGSGQNAGEHTELPNEGFCLRTCADHGRYGHLHDSPGQLPEKSKYFLHDYNTEEMGKLFTGYYFTAVAKEKPYQGFEFDNLHSNYKEQCVQRPTMLSGNSSNDHNNESKFSLDQNKILTDRQKIKETDEYKRAMEEEWASRQQQLQRQAEEAQRLRSRKRAEKMRIMDNERRQKQRLEEIRETRKKDEENLNMKDKLRVEVRKELRRLESMCFDMASLLRCLGIHVGPFPSPNEVQAAYKRACLKFHPDRLLSTDLRQQVEAEEKFKLISTMKEKFLK